MRSNSVKPGIKELCDFIEEQAEEANDPVFGDILLSKSKLSKPLSKPDQATRSLPKKFVLQPNATTMVTTSQLQPEQSQSKENCPACGGPHSLPRCYKFKKMTNDERVEILKKDHICFSCFIKGHYAVGCAQQPANCKSKHQSIMHRTNLFVSSKETSFKEKRQFQSTSTEVTTYPRSE